MYFSLMQQIRGRRRVIHSQFSSIDDARRFIQARFGQYYPSSFDPIVVRKESNPHYVEVWNNPDEIECDMIIVSVDSNNEFVAWNPS